MSFDRTNAAMSSQPAMSLDRTERAGRSFVDVWSEKIYPVIKDDYAMLVGKSPTRRTARMQVKAEKKAKKKDKNERKQTAASAANNDVPTEDYSDDEAASAACAHADNQERLQEIVTAVHEKKEKRNVYMNLAWTGPIDNTSLQANISYEKVAHVAIDLFCDPAVAAAAASADNLQATRPDTATEEDACGRGAKRSVFELILAGGPLPWRVPESVERGFEIPIYLTNAESVPECGKFPRLGMDVVVNAVWLAYSWAKAEDNANAASALEKLILDWPMDFVLIEGNTPEEVEQNKFVWGVNFSAKVERLRDMVGLASSNLMRIVAKAAELTLSKLTGVKKANARVIQEWLAKHVNWGALRCPNTETVERLLGNWAHIHKNPKVLELIEAAVQRWGRNNLLDWPTKIGIIITKSDASSLGYVVESLYAQMWRKDSADPYGSIELKKVISEILWTRQYIAACCRQYPELISRKAESAVAAQRMLQAPLELFMKTEGPDRDPTWVQSLPNEALRCFMKHVLELSQGLFKPEIQGALLRSPADKFNVEKFHQTTRVSQRFATAFKVAYDSLLAASAQAKTTEAGTQPSSVTDGQAAASAGAETSPPSSSGGNFEKRPELREMRVSSFRTECEEHCRRELEARLVLLVMEGDHMEIQKSVTTTRLYQNLTEDVPLMGFYDVKNARLCNIFEGEGLMHREPVLDVGDVERFLATVVPLMRPGRDLIWVLAGRTESNQAKLKKSCLALEARNPRFATRC